LDLSNEQKLLLLCVGAGIPGEKTSVVNAIALLPLNWDELLNTAASQQIAPMVYKRLKEIPEKARVPQEIMGKLKTAYHGNIARNMYLYSELVPILRLCKEQEVDVMLLKGAALAGTVYGDIGLRKMGDIDLLVRPESLPVVKEVMSGLGYAFISTARSEEWYKQNHFHLPPYVHKEKPVVIEIHWHVCQDYIGIDVKNWWKRAGIQERGGVPVFVPSPEDMVLHLCLSMFHGNYKSATLRGLCDIHETLRHFSNQINWELFCETVERSEISRPVYSLLYLVWKYFDNREQRLLPIEQMPVDSNFSVLLEEITFDPGSISYAVFMRALSADTVWKKTRLVFSEIFPSRERMSERYSTGPASAKIYFYYAYRLFELAVKYWRAFFEMFYFRKTG